MKLLDTDNLKRYILENYDQVTVFATYLEIAENDINYCLQNTSNTINNPLRHDVNPSLGFMYVLDKETGLYKLRMYDWADSFYRGDCFDIVGKIHQLQRKENISFISICRDIILVMDKKTTYHIQSKHLITTQEEKFTNIHIEARDWNGADIKLWNDWGLPFNELLGTIFCINRSFISNFNDYNYDETDPGYAWISGYYQGYTLYNLYFPFRSGKDKFKPRFKTNNRYYPLQCIHLLKPADILLITKARKEQLLFKRLIPKLGFNYSIEVAAATSEASIMSDDFIQKLFNIYPTIVTNYDFDRTGLTSSGMYKRKYGILRFMLTNGKFGTYDFGGKDYCDYYHNKGEVACNETLIEAYNYLKHEIELDYEKNLS